MGCKTIGIFFFLEIEVVDYLVLPITAEHLVEPLEFSFENLLRIRWQLWHTLVSDTGL
jgi:hypothetical protein